MNEKEFNLQILAKVREIANEVFNHVKLNIEGTFTASELWKGKNYAGEEINIDWGNNGRVRHTAQIDTYKFEVTSDHIFYLVWKFERLCGVTQKEKSRYTFGEYECESISEKTMYMNIKGQILTRKKDMVKLYDNIAYSIEGKRANPFVLYVFAGKLWYMVGDAKDKDTMGEHVKLLRQKDFILANLKRRPELVDESKCMYAPIFKALYEVLCAEAIKDTPEERKPERKATRTAFARQKVFPNELYLRRRKIRRFKRLSFAGYTNYHPRVESAANQAEIGSKRAPGTLRIRGSTIAGFQSGERIRIT